MKKFLNKIIFKSQNPLLEKSDISVPSPAQRHIPKWYKDADRFAKNPHTNEYIKASKEVCPVAKEGTVDDYGKIPTWKACPSIMDSFLTGYFLKTPCDIKFFKNINGFIDVEVSDSKHKNFCTRRFPMPQFKNPHGFYEDHFAWFSPWGLKLPEGYSALYMTPMNRFDLPFLNTVGIVDNDKLTFLGSFPFFLAKDWEGTIPAGTPYMQILPFKREDWEHEVEINNAEEIYIEVTKKNIFRKPDGGVYKNEVWSKREYK